MKFGIFPFFLVLLTPTSDSISMKINNFKRYSRPFETWCCAMQPIEEAFVMAKWCREMPMAIKSKWKYTSRRIYTIYFTIVKTTTTTTSLTKQPKSKKKNVDKIKILRRTHKFEQILVKLCKYFNKIHNFKPKTKIWLIDYMQPTAHSFVPPQTHVYVHILRIKFVCMEKNSASVSNTTSTLSL